MSLYLPYMSDSHLSKDKVIKIFLMAKNDKLKSLNLGNRDIQDLPSEIGYLKELKSLVLWGNHFETLPSEIGALENLKTLDLNRTSLSRLPPEIGKLRKLT